jgi:hypothetical protein
MRFASASNEREHEITGRRGSGEFRGFAGPEARRRARPLGNAAIALLVTHEKYSPPPRLPPTIGLIFQLPARSAWVLARLSRGPELRSRWYVSTGPERKGSQNPGSVGVVTS